MSEQKDNLWQRIEKNIRYCISGVWNDTRSLWSVKIVKIVNLSVQAFLDRDLQVRACALTYNTVLAVVPALAMLFAIARGFGFQNLLQSELFRYFPAQRQALETALTYVDNYLAQASQGVFIGIGLIVLLWTLVSLMGNVEDTFNHVWNVSTKRSLQRKITDYTALFLLLPVLMVCSAGITIFMSDAVQRLFQDNALSPMMHRLLSFMPTVISWFVFTAAYYLVPNTKVKFKGALYAGVICGTLFQVIQWLFVSGQVYVSKYNAIYGSFAFLPLVLIWLQLSWLITLSGVVLTYAWQNFDSFAHRDKAKGVSQTYANNLAIAVLALAAQRFKNREQAITRNEIIRNYDIPGPLADKIFEQLKQSGLLTVITKDKDDDAAYQPAFDPDDMTVNMAANALTDLGNTHFIAKADTQFAQLLERITTLREDQQSSTPDIALCDLL
ncbi:MAG: YihY/virulence factor BrkB family protein [Muribaculaceae bacterium]|nr:YihY/virulence factor BrkB family protein [Muribaculaceae bacterium]